MIKIFMGKPDLDGKVVIRFLDDDGCTHIKFEGISCDEFSPVPGVELDWLDAKHLAEWIFGDV